MNLIILVKISLKTNASFQVKLIWTVHRGQGSGHHAISFLTSVLYELNAPNLFHTSQIYPIILTKISQLPFFPNFPLTPYTVHTHSTLSSQRTMATHGLPSSSWRRSTSTWPGSHRPRVSFSQFSSPSNNGLRVAAASPCSPNRFRPPEIEGEGRTLYHDRSSLQPVVLARTRVQTIARLGQIDLRAIRRAREPVVPTGRTNDWSCSFRCLYIHMFRDLDGVIIHDSSPEVGDPCTG